MRELELSLSYKVADFDLDDAITASIGKRRADFDGGAGMGRRNLDANFVIAPEEVPGIMAKLAAFDPENKHDVRVAFCTRVVDED